MITYVCVYTHMHMYVCVYVYMCIYVFETIIQMTCFQAVFYNQKIHCAEFKTECIMTVLSMLSIKRKKMEVDLLLWHVYYFNL